MHQKEGAEMPTSTTIECTSVLNSPGRDNQEDLPTVRQHPARGLAARANGGAEELTQCPFCGGRIIRCEIQDSAGERAFSLCCGIPQEFVDNFDVYRDLPEPLQRIAIERKQEEYAAMTRKSRENARRFRESLDHWYAKYAHLTKEASDGHKR